jgi:hypothetical protein
MFPEMLNYITVSHVGKQILNVSVTLNMTTILDIVLHREFFKHNVSETWSSFRNAFFKTTQRWPNVTIITIYIMWEKLRKVFIMENIFMFRKLSTCYELVIQMWFIGFYLIIKDRTNWTCYLYLYYYSILPSKDWISSTRCSKIEIISHRKHITSSLERPSA